jgi:hypothetical protein
MLTRAVLVALLTLGIAGAAWAQATPTGQATQPPAADRRGTDKEPLVIKEATTDESRTKAQHEAENEAGKASRERQIIWATWAIALVTSFLMAGTVFLAFYTSRLWKETKRLARETKETGDAQIATITQNAQRQLRAYPGIREAKIVLSESEIYAEIVVINDSPTPAYEFDWGFSVRICALNAPPPKEDPLLRNLQWDMVTGAKTALNRRRKIAPGQRAAVLSGKKKVILWGIVKYRDAFSDKRNRFIRFRYRHGKDLTPVGAQVSASGWLEPEDFHSN